jgi:hypothetical protein
MISKGTINLIQIGKGPVPTVEYEIVSDRGKESAGNLKVK